MHKSVLDAIDTDIVFEDSIDEKKELHIFEGLSGVLDGMPVSFDRKKPAVNHFLSCLERPDCEEKYAVGLLIRMASVEGLLVGDSSNPVEARICGILESRKPEIFSSIKLDRKKQTYEKISAIRKIYPSLISELKGLISENGDIDFLLSRRSEVMRLLRSQRCEIAIDGLGLGEVVGQVDSIYRALSDLSKSGDRDFHAALDKVRRKVSDGKISSNGRSNYLYSGFFSDFLNLVEAALSRFESDSRDQFDCRIEAIRSGEECALKRYPLYLVNSDIVVDIPLRNVGPGMARNVTVILECHEEAVLIDGELLIGDVEPGRFDLVFPVMTEQPIDSLRICITISWMKYGDEQIYSDSFPCRILSQRSDIDWSAFEYEEPYSTEPAEHEDFVGREVKLKSLVKRIMKKKMQSSYISGQKRVGKTSLAKALKDCVKKMDPVPDVEFIFLEWGDYSHKDSFKAVSSLAKKIYIAMRYFCPAVALPEEPDFDGTLSPLVDFVYLASRLYPEKSFVIVLDEFDEIHPDMYKYGALAETFFSNIRTLSSKDNVAFVLIGGESMPFVIDAQGDQLNKFVHEPLSYFGDDEWSDFCSLVRSPTKGVINWHESSVRMIFDVCHGHPYYAKLLCSEVFSRAISERDSEVVEEDVERAIARIMPRLDANVFSHFWKDGIHSSDERECEVVSNDRRRILLAIANLMRDEGFLKVEDVYDSASVSQMGIDLKKGLLGDFSRRSILDLSDGKVSFVIPFFGYWLRDQGYKRLVDDGVEDQYHRAARERSDELRIKNHELVSLSERVCSYRGRRVSPEHFSAWLHQVDSLEDQRLLFKILDNTHFSSQSEISESMKKAYAHLQGHVPAFTQTKRNQRRTDVALVYVDGEGKSGQRMCTTFVEENRLSVKAICNGDGFRDWADKYESANSVVLNSVVIVDDVVATGDTLSKKVTSFVSDNRDFIKDRNLVVFVVAVYAFEDGAERVQKKIEALDVNVEFYCCNTILDSDVAFPKSGSGFWADEVERDKAYALCNRLGSKIYKNNPLGYGGLGLLLVFPHNCPNNSLPILHSSSKGAGDGWRPIFERVVH